MFTLRELLDMAEARQRVEWDRTCSIIAKIHNVNCTKQSQTIKDPTTLNPFRHKRSKVKGSVGELAALLGA